MRVVIIFAASGGRERARASSLALPPLGVTASRRGPHDFELRQRSFLRHSILTSLLVREGRDGRGEVCLLRKGNRWPRHSVRACEGCRRCRVPIKSICPSVRDAGLPGGKHGRRVAGPSGRRESILLRQLMYVRPSARRPPDRRPPAAAADTAPAPHRPSPQTRAESLKF